ncbi:unnamed protein product, partial [Rotaria magnacalcarata]
MSSSTLPSSSNNMKCDVISSCSNQINIDSPTTSYLIADAKVNGDKSSPPIPYTGPDIHGPEGSSICPVGWVTVDIAIAG